MQVRAYVNYRCNNVCNFCRIQIFNFRFFVSDFEFRKCIVRGRYITHTHAAHTTLTQHTPHSRNTLHAPQSRNTYSRIKRNHAQQHCARNHAQRNTDSITHHSTHAAHTHTDALQAHHHRLYIPQYELDKKLTREEKNVKRSTKLFLLYLLYL